MKKKLLIGIITFAIATIAAFNINMISNKIQPFALSLTNVEALADESGSDPCRACGNGPRVCCIIGERKIYSPY